jgi:hypothetical protein
MPTDCPCISWVRIPISDGKLPISLHHPSCDKYVLEDFVMVSVNGMHCTMEPWEADDPEFDDPEYTKTPVKMTRDQFEQLPEFEGF